MNQFDHPIRFFALAWRAIDEETGAVLTVCDSGPDNVTWSLRVPARKGASISGHVASGRKNNPTLARAAARRALEQHKKARTTESNGNG